MKPKILVIDCNGVGYMIWHALGDNLTFDDMETGVLFGFMRHMFLLAKKFETDRFVFCWDSRKNLRKDMYSGYKRDRHKVAEDVPNPYQPNPYAQFNELRQKILPTMFSNVLIQTGHEADDLVAQTVIQNYMDHELIVVSQDNDMWQLLRHCDIWNPRKKEMFTADDLEDLKGVPPEQWVAVKALMGDGSDNIAGIMGIGETWALRIVRQEIPKTHKKVLMAESEQGREIFTRNMALMKLPLPTTHPITIKPEPVRTLDAFFDMCSDYGFRSFMDKHMDDWINTFNMVDE